MSQCSYKDCTTMQSEPEMPKLVCSGCKVAYYCGRECQGADWKSHKKACQSPKAKTAARKSPRGLSLRVNQDELDYESQAIRTVKMSILNAELKMIGGINIFIIPKKVGQSGEYFEFLDCLDRDLSAFAYRCTTNKGHLKSEICTYQGTRRWNPSDSTQLAFIDEVFVEEASRNQGIGTWAIQNLMEKYDSQINMIATRPTLLRRCDPLLQRPFNAPPPTKQELAEYTAREEGVAEFFSKVGFRKLGKTEFIGLAKDPNHPSRSLLPSDDLPFEKVAPPQTEQEHHRYALMNDGMPYGL